MVMMGMVSVSGNSGLAFVTFVVIVFNLRHFHHKSWSFFLTYSKYLLLNQCNHETLTNINNNILYIISMKEKRR
uniref:Uncharacterized protein n=1 Tax=Octopus bimaculoides TaxID=37653 RepID=A0A0L8I6V2_OCTBM